MICLDDLFRTPVGKVFFRGTERSRNPLDTLSQVWPLLKDFGITRVANVTGLDRIGIPVYVTTRPNARSLSVAQGKGIDADSAKISSIMEAIEAYHAEFPLCGVRVENYRALRTQGAVADPEALPLRRGSLFTEQQPIPWAAGLDLITGEPVWVPFELVHANATLPAIPGSGCFTSSTNGLASGNERIEAILHAIYEVIERDALAMWDYSASSPSDTCRLDLSTVDDPSCVELLRKFQDAEVPVTAWNITSDVGLPTFMAMVFDASTDYVLKPVPGTHGYGCHLDPGIALSRALTEAAQSRVTIISGSRDDVSRARYGEFQSTQALESCAAASGSGCVDFHSVRSSSGVTFEEDLLQVLRRLRSIGIDRVIAVDLSRPGLAVSVVRVIIPGLEGPSESPWYQPGARVRGRAA